MAFFKELIVKIKGDSSQLQSETNKAKGIVTGFDNSLKSVGAGIAAAFSVKAVIDFGKASVRAFDEASKSSAKLLSSLNGNVEAHRRLSNQAKMLQSNSLFDDESIQGAQMFLATMKLTESQITRILPLVMDFATKTGTDLVSAANLISKTIGSSTNALGRYGIEVEGVAGSSARFEATLAGLTKQVGGLSKAATEAGTSSLVQLRNAINDIQEAVGERLAKPMNKFISNLRDIIMLKSGDTAKNYATQYETDARNFAAQAESTEQAREILVKYIQAKQEQIQLTLKDQQEHEKAAKAHWLNGTAMREEQAIAKTLGADVDGMREAVKRLTVLLGDSKGLEALIKDNDVSVIEDATKAITELDRVTASYLKNASYIQPAAGTETAMGPFQYGEPIVGPIIPGDQIPSKKLPGFGDKQLAPSIITPEYIADLEKVRDLYNQQYEAMAKMDPMVDQLASSLNQLGSTLAQGGEDWQDFGQKALSALKEMVSGLIAAGVASAIEGAIVKYSTISPLLAGGIGAVAGGLAAGAFSTALNQLPSFANGGMVNGPTLALVGDNPGRKEMIIPSEMFGAMGGGELSARVTGEQLEFILNRRAMARNRT